MLFLFQLVVAQKFVYVSSLFSDTPLVSKLFLYDKGESQPLTSRLEADDPAYDPVPSPNGQQIAYLEKNALGWSLVVVDLIAGLRLEFLASFALSPERTKFALLEANDEGFSCRFIRGEKKS